MRQFCAHPPPPSTTGMVELDQALDAGGRRSEAERERYQALFVLAPAQPSGTWRSPGPT